MDAPPAFVNSALQFLSDNRPLLMVLITAAIGSGFGAWFGAQAILTMTERRRRREIQGTANISIAALVALLGKLINFKKDMAQPALQDAVALEEKFAAQTAEETHVGIKLELWPEIPFGLHLPHEKLFAQAGEELDVIQLVKMLDYNLAELVHLVRQRNGLIQSMNAHQAAKGALPHEGLKLYIRYAKDLARNLDESLFFTDRAINRIRDAARKILPEKMHRGIADVGLKPEVAPLMPPKDLLKGVVK